jgi:hypothetical protein
MKDIIGHGGGKGGGGQTFRESENTLRANVIVSSLEAWGEGPIVGPVAGAKSIYLNQTPLQNGDGSFNFGGKVAFEYRSGLPVQDTVKGFEEAGDPVTVNTEITNAAPVIQTVGDAATTVIGLTIALPQGLYEQDTTNNELRGAAVELLVEVKLSSSGVWQKARSITYNDKITSAYQETFRINRPSGSGLWDVRVSRVTADSAASSLRNNTFWAFHTELQPVANVTYPNVAYGAIQLDAAAVNSSAIPVRSAEVYGLIVQVPTNYNVRTRAYTGVWDGLFKNDWTNDPAWILYDLITNTRYGLGLDESLVDAYSFYSASLYNSELLSFTNKSGVLTSAPRFSFNFSINNGELAPELLNKVASVMNAKVMWMGGQITVLQDRPTDYTHLFTKANVIGEFKYVGTALQQRNTVVNVTWNDPSSRYQQRVSSVEDTVAIAKYGYNPANIAAFGCTGEAQAIRYGKWYLDTLLNSTETVTFTTGLEGQLVLPNEVIRIHDEQYAPTIYSGRVISSSVGEIVLDRPVSISGTSSIDVRVNGALESGTVTAAVGDTITVTGLSGAADAMAPFILSTAGVSPRDFRVTRVSEQARGIYQIEAAFYDAAKYARIETGVVVPPKVFSDPLSTTVQKPTNLVFTERVLNVDNSLKRSLVLSWTPSVSTVVARYQVTYRVNDGQVVTVTSTVPNYEIQNVSSGVTSVKVFAVSYKDVLSLPLTGTYTVATTEAPGGDLDAVTDFFVQNTSGTTFGGRTLAVTFVNPTSNGSKPSAVGDFKVEVKDGASILRTEYLPGVLPGLTQTYVYDYDKNLFDAGPRRSVTIVVTPRDGNKLLGDAATKTFSNPVPDPLANTSAVGGVGSIKILWDKPTDTDFGGVLVHRSATPGFVVGPSNLIADTTASYFSDTALTGSTFYYKVAAYDAFGKTDLNFSAELSATMLASAGIPSGATLPLTGAEGDLFYNTTDGKLYRYHSGSWTAEVGTIDLVGTLTSTQIGTDTVQSSNIAASAVGSAELGAGSVLSEKIGDGQVTYDKLTITDINNYAINGAMKYRTTTPGTSPYAHFSKVTEWTADASSELIGVSGLNYALLRKTSGSTAVAYNQPFDTSGVEVLLLVYQNDRGIYPGTIEGSIDLISGSGSFTSDIQTGTSADGPWTTVANIGLATSGWVRMTFTPTDTSVKRVRLKMTYTQVSVGFGGPGDIDGDGFSDFGQLGDVTLRKMNAGKLIVDGGITTNLLAASSVVADKIAAGSIVAGKLAADSVVALNIAANAVEADKIAANAVTADKITANAVTAGKINASAVESDKIAANAITTDKIAANAIVADKITAGTITATQIADTTITGSKLVDSTITSAKISDYIASDDFNGTIVDGVVTANGTAGWVIAKGDGTAGSGKMVIDAAEIRGTLNADAITVDGSFVSNPGGVRNWDGWYSVSFDSTGLLDQHAGNMAGTAGTNPMYARLDGLGMATIPVVNPSPPANGLNTAWNAQVSLTCRVFSSTPAWAAVVVRMNDTPPDAGDIDASGDFANVVPMFNRTIDGSSGKTFRTTLPLPSWGQGSTDDVYLWISIQLLDSSGQPLSGFTATGDIGWEIHLDQLTFAI